MKRSICNGIVVGLAVLPLMAPPSVWAAGPPIHRVNAVQFGTASRQAAVVDVALGDRGQLAGRVVTADGTAVAGMPVSVAYRGQDIARTTTDRQGRFAVIGLRGGVYQITAPGTLRSVRLWAPRTAPPAAQQGMTLVAQSPPIVRGQSIDGGSGLITSSLVVGGVVATAVAVPLATHSQTTRSERNTE